MKYGIIAMSAKPFHRGHEAIIKQASWENDHVFLITSLATRERKGQKSIDSKHVVTLWQDFILQKLPTNIETIFTNGTITNNKKDVVTSRLLALWKNSDNEAFKKPPEVDTPVRWSWWLMSGLIANSKDDECNVYVGPDDAERYSIEKVKKYVIDSKRCQIVVPDHGGDRLFGISGTKMRQFLVDNDKKSFVENLPTFFNDSERENIWKIFNV